MGQHYARTLQEWRRRFWPPLSSASAFASSACGTSASPTPKLVSGPGYLDVHQLLLDRGQMAGLGR